MAAKILSVDDSETMRQLLVYTLSDEGYEVSEASNADEALHAVGKAQFDLIIADVNMPGRSGIELVREVRAMPAFKFTPILMLTTESNATMKQAGRDAGATGWIVKPFSPDALVGAVRKLVG